MSDNSAHCPVIIGRLSGGLYPKFLCKTSFKNHAILNYNWHTFAWVVLRHLVSLAGSDARNGLARPIDLVANPGFRTRLMSRIALNSTVPSETGCFWRFLCSGFEFRRDEWQVLGILFKKVTALICWGNFWRGPVIDGIKGNLLRSRIFAVRKAECTHHGHKIALCQRWFGAIAPLRTPSQHGNSAARFRTSFSAFIFPEKL